MNEQQYTSARMTALKSMVTAKKAGKPENYETAYAFGMDACKMFEKRKGTTFADIYKRPKYDHIEERRQKVVAFISSNPGLSRAEIQKQMLPLVIKGHDFDSLRRQKRIHAVQIRPSDCTGFRFTHYAGPRQQAAAE